MAGRNRSRDLTVGAFAMLALVVLAIGIMAVGGESKLFSRKATYRAVFPASDGLVIGSPVKMNGVQVGTVTGVRLSTDPGTTGIEVLLGVQRSYTERVREGSTAALRFLQYLSGEKYVEISPGDPAKPALEEGSVIPAEEGSKFLETGEDIADNLNQITVSLRQILEPLERGEGLLGEMLHDPNFGKEGLAAVRGVLENLQDLTARLKSGKGFAGRMLFDPALESKADDLGRAVTALSSALARIDRGEGAAGDLLAKEGASRKAIDDLAAAAASLRRVAAALESREGLAGRLLYDKEYADRVAEDLEATLANLRSITGKIDAGEGTLGALVNERTLYDGAEDVVAGVGDSKFARWLLRHYQKKGIESESHDAPKP